MTNGSTRLWRLQVPAARAGLAQVTWAPRWFRPQCWAPTKQKTGEFDREGKGRRSSIGNTTFTWMDSALCLCLGGEGKTLHLPRTRRDHQRTRTAPDARPSPHTRLQPRARSSSLDVKAVQEHARCGPLSQMVRACAERASSGICALSAHPLPGLVARVEALESVTPILVCLTCLAGAPWLWSPATSVCASGHSWAARSLFWERPESGAVWPGSFRAASYLSRHGEEE